MTDELQPLPVQGYKAQSQESVDRVNENKKIEEAILRILDDLATLDYVDKRWLAIGRTNLEQAFMAINRSIFKPNRINL